MRPEERLFSAFNGVDEALLARSERPARRRLPRAALGLAAAACLALLLLPAALHTEPLTPPGSAAASTPAPPPNGPATSVSDPLPAQDFTIPENAALHLLSRGDPAQEPTPAFALFINESHYFISETNGTYTVRPRTTEPLPAPCDLTVTHQTNITPEAAVEVQFSLLETTYKTVQRTETAVRMDDITLHAEDGTAWDAPQCDVTLISDGAGGVFILTARYFTEAAEGHGVRFSDMAASFYVISDPGALPAWLTALQDTAMQTAAALFAGQETDTQGAYGADVRGDLSIASIDYTVNDPLAPSHAIVSIEHRLGTEDSFTYLTLELTYAQEQWTVTFAGLEK